MKKIILCCTMLASSHIAVSQEALVHFIDSVAGSYLQKSHGGALMIGIHAGGEERVFSYGETEKGNKIKPGVNSLFEIGQITQVFTSALFAQMTIRGEINPDDPLSKYLPMEVPSPVYQQIVCEPIPQSDNLYEKGYGIHEKYSKYVCKPDPSSRPQPVLLCYLSTHTSGLPAKPGNLRRNSRNPYAGYSKDDLYEFLSGYSISKPIGYDFNYSVLNPALLGHVMELKTGKPFESLLDSALLKKIAADNTHIQLNESAKKHLLAGHASGGKVVPHWTAGIMAPAIGLHSDLTDMMKLLSINISPVRSELKDVFDYTHNARIRFTNKKYGRSEAALGWMISPLGKSDTKVVWQEGITGGFSSFIGFVETTRTGIVILSSNAAPVRTMGEGILSRMK